MKTIGLLFNILLAALWASTAYASLFGCTHGPVLLLISIRSIVVSGRSRGEDPFQSNKNGKFLPDKCQP